MYNKYFKQILDFIIALSALIILLPVFLIIILVLFFGNKREVFFIQSRPGKNAKPFNVIKFKTMNDKRDKNEELLPDADRLSPLGKFVRKTSLDEIPQLINVLKGDMSLIGPRPLLEEYISRYNVSQKRRHEIRPGITGWAQVNGRNTISWEQKFEYDVWYVDNISILLDIKIIFLTIKKVFVKEGISSKTSATMELFKGNE